MKLLSEIISSDVDLLALEPEELGGVLLEVLLSNDVNQGFVNRTSFFASPDIVKGYPPTHGEEIRHAVMEAWVWLEREGLIAPRPEDHTGLWTFCTRRGRALKNRLGVASYRRANLLPKNLLHPAIATKVYGLFLRGDYDTAVFQAFKEIEVAVRKGGGYKNEDLGTGLMRKAFHPEDGPLRDFSATSSERQSMSDLFAGAIGAYKNPHSHRNVDIDAEEAVELLMLASHLLKLVDFRTHHCKH